MTMIQNDRGNYTLKYEGASCHLNKRFGFPQDMFLLSLETQEDQQQKGHATFLLKAVKNWANKKNKRVILWARPYYSSNHKPPPR